MVLVFCSTWRVADVAVAVRAVLVLLTGEEADGGTVLTSVGEVRQCVGTGAARAHPTVHVTSEHVTMRMMRTKKRKPKR